MNTLIHKYSLYFFIECNKILVVSIVSNHKKSTTFAKSYPSFRYSFAGIIGNLLEHYDSALFALLAPFLAPLFFGEQDPVTALILTYGILPLGFLTRPLGSLFFTWLGDHLGRRQALFCSLLGMAIITIGIGTLPTYHEIGMWAPLFLAFAKMVQSFCAAGESTTGAIFVLEHTEVSKRGVVGSLYDSSSICGILVASGIVTFMSSQGFLEESWRLLFWAGGGTAILGFFLRISAKDEIKFEDVAKTKKIKWILSLKENKGALIAIIVASGFSHITYALSFTLMNGYIPLITSLSKTEVMEVNTLLLIVDMCLLPCFGYLANKFGKEKMMLTGALCSVLGAIPLFSLLEHASIGTVVFVRLAIITSGVAFAAPYYAWAMERIASPHRYLILSLGGALGSQLIGAPTSATCLWLYKTFNWTAAPALYLVLGGIAAGFVVVQVARKKIAHTVIVDNNG